MSELVERGEKMLRDGLGSPNSNPSKLNDSICAQLCEAGLEALSRATRYAGCLLMSYYHRVPFSACVITSLLYMQILLREKPRSHTDTAPR